MNTLAIILITFSVLQIILGITVIAGKFDPLLPKERKKLPKKLLRKAHLLNAGSMITTSIALCVLGVAMLLNSELLYGIAIAIIIISTIIFLILALKLEWKYVK